MEPLVIGPDQVIRYIPQRSPMVMVDALWESDDEHCLSGLTVMEDNLFVTDGYLQAEGLIEHMAQTAALHAGYQAHQQNTSPQVGFIGAVKQLTIHRLPATGSLLRSHLTLSSQLLGASIVQVTVTDNGGLIADGSLSIFQNTTE